MALLQKYDFALATPIPCLANKSTTWLASCNTCIQITLLSLMLINIMDLSHDIYVSLDNETKKVFDIITRSPSLILLCLNTHHTRDFLTWAHAPPILPCLN